MALDMNQNDPTIREMCELGRDVLESRDMQALRTFHQHGVISRYEHCLSVCYIVLRLADKWHVDVDRRSMVRGALLHDFFMYDWHDPGNLRLLHGFTHAKEALSNARKQFELNEVECDVIQKHMFPLNIALPKYWETVLVSAENQRGAGNRSQCQGSAHSQNVQGRWVMTLQIAGNGVYCCSTGMKFSRMRKH